MRNANVSLEDFAKFVRGTAEADFLSGKDITEYLRQVYSRCVTLRRTNDQYRDYTQEIPAGYDHEKVVNEMHETLIWLTTQTEVAKSKFRPYLHVGR